MDINITKTLINMKTSKKIVCLYLLSMYILSSCISRHTIMNRTNFVKKIDTISIDLKISLIDTIDLDKIVKPNRYRAIGVELVNKTNTSIASGRFDCVFLFVLSYFHNGEFVNPIYIANWKKDCLSIPDTLLAESTKKILLPLGFDNNYYEKPYPLKGDSLIIHYQTSGMNLTNKEYIKVRGKGVIIF
jgi:hypothetical protein